MNSQAHDHSHGHDGHSHGVSADSDRGKLVIALASSRRVHGARKLIVVATLPWVGAVERTSLAGINPSINVSVSEGN